MSEGQGATGGRWADLADELENAPIAARPAKADQSETKPETGGKPPKKTGDRTCGEIWEGCPVRPLGVNGENVFFLDRHGQMQARKKLDAQAIMFLFGDAISTLCSRFPQYDREGHPRADRFDQTTASMRMYAAASEKGLFNPDGAVRGVGAWVDDDGRLVYHCGPHLYHDGARQDPCDLDGKVYPAYPGIPDPAPVGGRGDPAPEILTTFESWNWEHPSASPMVALGMIGAQMLGGALDWRPAYWMTGDAACGKSTFQDLVKHLHGGDKGLVQSTEATKAGITSRLGHSSLPVALDELEPGDEGSTKERDIITLARVASSGGQWLRGSSDHKGASGNVYSTFFFSSILIPGTLGPQDRSRLITLSLRPLDRNAPKLSLDPRTWRARGARLKRLLMDRWPSWPERLQLWREAMAGQGLAGRNGDNWATTFAMADMALSADLPDANTLRLWSERAAAMAVFETEEIGTDAEDMVVHLMGQPLDVYRRGELWHVAHWVMTAAQLPNAPDSLVLGTSATEGAGFITSESRRKAAQTANATLAKYGMRVRGEGHEAELFIANKPLPALAALFKGSRWARGVWAQSSKRLRGAEPVPQPLSLAGQRTRGVYVPLQSVAGMITLPMDREAPGGTAGRDDDWEGFAE